MVNFKQSHNKQKHTYYYYLGHFWRHLHRCFEIIRRRALPKDEIEISCRAAAKQTHKTYAIIAAKTQHQGPELIPEVYKEVYLLQQ